VAFFLVTGGCGFIGSHLCLALQARGDTVRVLDDLSTGRLENLAPGAELICGDVADSSTLQIAMHGADGCFHLAAIASVERGTQDWLGTHRANLTGSITVFEAARARCVPVVYASSAAVFGNQSAMPITEDTPKLPISAYGADKLGCEQQARVAGIVHRIPTLGLRFFNVFGPRQDPSSPYSGVISIFCDRLSRGQPIAVYGDGGQTRDFVYVDDVVDALLAGMVNADITAPVYNVCTGRATSVFVLAETIGLICGRVPVLQHRQVRLGEIRHSVGDPTRFRAALGLLDQRELRYGLAEVIHWLKVGQPGADALQSVGHGVARDSGAAVSEAFTP